MTEDKSQDNKDQGGSLKEMFKAEREELSEVKESVNELTEVLKQPLESQDSDGPTQLSEMDGPEDRDDEEDDEVNVKESIQSFKDNFSKVGEILENLHERLKKVEGNYADDDMEDEEEGDYEDEEEADDDSDSQSPDEPEEPEDTGDDTSDDEDEEEPQPPKKGESFNESIRGSKSIGDSDMKDVVKDVL